MTENKYLKLVQIDFPRLCKENQELKRRVDILEKQNTEIVEQNRVIQEENKEFREKLLQFQRMLENVIIPGGQEEKRE